MDRLTKLHRMMIDNYGGAFTERYAKFIDDFISEHPGMNRKQAAKHPDVKGSYAWNKRRTLGKIFDALELMKTDAYGKDILDWTDPSQIQRAWQVLTDNMQELRGKAGAYRAAPDGSNRDILATKRPKTRRPRASRPPVAIPSTSTSEPIVIEGRTPKDIHTQFVRHYMLSNGIRNWIDGLTGAAPSWAQFKADHNIVKRRVR